VLLFLKMFKCSLIFLEDLVTLSSGTNFIKFVSLKRVLQCVSFPEEASMRFNSLEDSVSLSSERDFI
jgi:hypothetical protein